MRLTFRDGGLRLEPETSDFDDICKALGKDPTKVRASILQGAKVSFHLRQAIEAAMPADLADVVDDGTPRPPR